MSSLIREACSWGGREEGGRGGDHHHLIIVRITSSSAISYSKGSCFPYIRHRHAHISLLWHRSYLALRGPSFFFSRLIFALFDYIYIILGYTTLIVSQLAPTYVLRLGVESSDGEWCW
jgi:hypothetical protein